MFNPYLLLILSGTSVFLTVVADNFIVEGFVRFLFTNIMILIAIRMTREYKRAFSSKILTITLVLILVSIVGDGLFYWKQLPSTLEYSLFIGAALIRVSLFSYGWLLVVKMLATQQKATDRTIVTAIIGYFFIGIIWSFVYLAIWQLDPQAFHISVLQDYEFKPWNLAMYFSFTTLTTVGYGDIIPVNRWVMAFANFEAMIGAIYLTVVVARLVSLYGNPSNPD